MLASRTVLLEKHPPFPTTKVYRNFITRYSVIGDVRVKDRRSSGIKTENTLMRVFNEHLDIKSLKFCLQ
jgi:hypothetical protein